MERVWIEKEDGGQRPIGKPAFEDKRVQRAVTMLLEAIDEQDFYDGSYGFRPGRSPHKARQALREWCMTEGSGWMVEPMSVDTSTVLTGLDDGKCSASGSMMDGYCASLGNGSVPGS